MKKIVFFSHRAGFKEGGMGSVFTTFANALTTDYDVCYVHNLPGDEVAYDNFNSSVKIVCQGVRKFRYCLPKLVHTLNSEKPDVVITGGGYGNVFVIIASHLSKVRPKIILAQHNYSNGEDRTPFKSLYFRLYNKADYVTAVSKGVSSFMIKNGVKKEKIKILYNPIDIQRIKLMASEKTNISLPSNYIMFLGRTTPLKNLFLLLKAFEILVKEDETLKLIIVGDGSDKEKLEKYSESNGLNRKVIFAGQQSNPFPYIKNAKAVVLPSFSEALPMVILEAFALGVTVIATPTFGSLELLRNGELGYVTKSFDDPLEMSLTIKKGLDNPINPKLLIKVSSYFAVDIITSELKKIIEK